MIAQGAKIIFSTSYGYKDYADHARQEAPGRAFLQQGGTSTTRPPTSAPTSATSTRRVYLGGMAAGKATKSGKLGFVAAFPIPQTLLNINAFELGAQSVNPKAKTYVVFTGSWCDPGKQAEAAKSPARARASTCSASTRTAPARSSRRRRPSGAYSVGYHFDASSLAPKGWLTGSEWNWGPLMVKMVKTVVEGKFKGSPILRPVPRPGVPSGVIKLAPFGAAATPAIRKEVDKTYSQAEDGLGPLRGADQGPVREGRGRRREDA